MSKNIELNLGQPNQSEKGTSLPDDFKYLAIAKITLAKPEIEKSLARLDQQRLKTSRVTTESGVEIMRAASLTKEGKKVNEDSYFCYYNATKRFLAAGVFDGVGGQSSGEVASSTLKKNMLKAFSSLPPSPLWSDVAESIQQACDQTIQALDQQGLFDSDSTLTIFYGVPDPEFKNQMTFFVVHAGDSSAYHFSESDRKLIKLTKDETPVQALKDAGALSDLEAKLSPIKNVIDGSLMAGSPQTNNNNIPDLKYTIDSVYNPKPGDYIDIYSDGITDQFRDDTLEGNKSNELEYFAAQERLSPEQLIAAADARRLQHIEGLSKNDDATVVRITIPNFENNLVISENIKQAVLNNEALKGILAFYVDPKGSSRETRAKITGATIETYLRIFLKEYPSEEEFINKQAKELFFTNFESGDRRKYEQFMSVFQDVIYKD